MKSHLFILLLIAACCKTTAQQTFDVLNMWNLQAG